MTCSHIPCERGQDVFLIPLFACSPRRILFLVYVSRDLEPRSYYLIVGDSHCFFRVCFTMGPNIFLRGNGDYGVIFSDPLGRNGVSGLVMRGIYGR